jgi:ankyrin repeat protein
MIEVIREGNLDILKKMNLSTRTLNMTFRSVQFPLLGEMRSVHVACMFGQQEILDWLLAQGCALATRIWTEQTPQWVCAAFGQVKTLARIQARGNKLTFQQYLQMLGIAAHQGQVESVNWLLDNDFGMPLPQSDQLNLIRGAITSRNIELVTSLEARGILNLPKLLKKKNAHWWLGDAGLMVLDHDIEFWDYLVSRGWKPKKPKTLDEGLGRVLICAVGKSNLNFVRWIMDHDAYPYASEEFHTRVLQAATFEADIDMFKFVLDLGDRVQNRKKPIAATLPDLLKWAGSNPHSEVVKYLYQLGHSKGLQSDLEVLKAAARKGNLETIEWISINTTITNPADQDLIMADAMQSNNLPTIKWFVAHGYPLVLRSQNSSILHVAARMNNIDVAEWLVESKTLDINDKTGGSTPLQSLRQGWREEIRIWFQFMGGE